MLNAPLEIEIYVHTDETANKDNLEIDYDYNECVLEKCTLYTINYIYPYYHNKKEVGTYICSNGNSIITPIKYLDLQKLVNKRI